MPLARVGARTDSTTHYRYNARRGQYPRTRIGRESKTRCKICKYAPRVLHFSAFHLQFVTIYIAAFSSPDCQALFYACAPDTIDQKISAYNNNSIFVKTVRKSELLFTSFSSLFPVLYIIFNFITVCFVYHPCFLFSY